MILVTGGTGFLGASLLKELLRSNSSLRATYRTQDHLARVKEFLGESEYSKIDWTYCDITEFPDVERAMQGVDTVYHCAALISDDWRRFRKSVEINQQGTANIVNLCLAYDASLCHVSSIATLPSLPKTLTEEDFYNPDEDNSVYSITKQAAEMEVFRGMQEGLQAVIINPGVILGNAHISSFSNSILKRIKKGLKYYPTGSTGWVDVRDVVNIMIRLMGESHYGDRYILVSENKSYEEVLTKIALNADSKSPKKPIKPWMLQIYWRWNKIQKIFGGKHQISKQGARTLSKDSTYDNEKIVKLLDYCFIPLDKTIDHLSQH